MDMNHVKLLIRDKEKEEMGVLVTLIVRTLHCTSDRVSIQMLGERLEHCICVLSA